MAWEQRIRGPETGYYYRPVRIDRSFRKIYLGRGEDGHAAAAEVELRRQGRREARDLLRRDGDEAERLAAELREWAEGLLAVWMILTGHRKRRGQWRGMGMAEKPRVGSRAWEAALVDNPIYIKNTILTLAKQALGGNPEAVENLMQWLDRHPDMRGLVRELDDLATKVERAWMERLYGGNELSKKALTDELAAMKAGLLGPAPSVTDKVLASTVLVAHLGYQQAALAAAMPRDMPEVREAREKLLLKAQRRLQDAVKGWELHAGKKAKGLRPGPRIKIFEPCVA